MIRTTLAGAAVLTALTAAASFYKQATCGCHSPAIPYDTLGIAAGVASLILFAAYAILGRVRRPN